MIYLVIFILALLSIATVFIAYQIKQTPTPERLKNRKRLIAWWLIFTVIGFVLWSGPITILLFVNVVFLWVFLELQRLLENKVSNRYIVIRIVIGIAIGIILQLILNLILIYYPQASHILFVAAIAFAGLVFLTPVKSHFYLAIFSLYSSFSLLSIYLIVQLSQQASLDSAYLLLVLFFITAVNDVAQYISGALFGKTPIAPNISPNKTVEGVWGGVLISSLFTAMLLPDIVSISMLESFAIGSFLSLVGFLGDLNISKLKRSLNVKDSGSSILGHGGILDRVDSLLLTAPVYGLLLWSSGYL